MTHTIYLLRSALLFGFCCLFAATQTHANTVFVNITLKVSETSMLSKTTDLNIDSSLVVDLLSRIQQQNQPQTLVLPADPNQKVFLKQQPSATLPLGNTTAAKLTVQSANNSNMLDISLPDKEIEVFDPSGRSPLKFLLHDFNQHQSNLAEGEHSFNIGVSLAASTANDKKQPTGKFMSAIATSYVGSFNVEINY